MFKCVGEIQVHSSQERFFPVSEVVYCMHAAVQGRRAMIVQLLKGGIDQGPQKARTLLEHFVWLRPAVNRVIDCEPLPTECEAVQALWLHVLKQIQDLDVLVLDEAGIAVKYGLLNGDELVAVLKAKPTHLEIVLTGPEMPESIAPLVDQWTITRERTHIGVAGFSPVQSLAS